MRLPSSERFPQRHRALRLVCTHPRERVCGEQNLAVQGRGSEGQSEVTEEMGCVPRRRSRPRAQVGHLRDYSLGLFIGTRGDVAGESGGVERVLTSFLHKIGAMTVSRM